MRENARDWFEHFTPETEPEAGDRQAILRLFDVFDGDVLTRDNITCHLTASVWITDPAREKTVMAWHNIYKSWSWIGGHADGDSDLLRVAVRETREETGLDASPARDEPVSIELLGVNGHYKKGVWVAPHLHINATFHLIAPAGSVPRVKEDENSGIGFFTKEEALTLPDEPFMLPVYRKLIGRTML